MTSMPAPVDTIFTGIDGFLRIGKWDVILYKFKIEKAAASCPVTSLLNKDGGSGQYIALNRIISVISKNHNVWYLLLYTESKIERLTSR
jgi:hypothetical protein